MKHLIGLGVAAVVALFIALWIVYLVVAFVIVSAMSLLAWAVTDGLPVMVVAGVAALVTAIVLFRAGRLNLGRVPEGQDTPHV